MVRGSLTSGAFPEAVAAGKDFLEAPKSFQELRMRTVLTTFIALLPSLAAYGQKAGEFRLLATYRGLGGQFTSTVAPGPTPESEWLYASYVYMNNTLEVTSTDPFTGETKTYPNPAKGEFGARCMTTGPDGNVYIGTFPNAHLLKLDTKRGALVDLGRPVPTEQFIWDLAFGSDGRLYGGTQPGARLFRYDLRTGKPVDLGQMD